MMLRRILTTSELSLKAPIPISKNTPLQHNSVSVLLVHVPRAGSAGPHIGKRFCAQMRLWILLGAILAVSVSASERAARFSYVSKEPNAAMMVESASISGMEPSGRRRNLLQGIRGDLWVWDLAADSEDPLRPYVWSPERWEIQPLPFRLDRANQCYLEDLNAGCAVCWRTVAENQQISFGACPTNLMRLSWVRPPAQRMRKDTPYDVSFQVAVNTDQLAIVPHKGVDIVHADLHACVKHQGGCTPFTTLAPDRAMKSRTQSRSLDNRGTATFHQSSVTFPEGYYTIIAHARFYLPGHEEDCPPSRVECLDTIDAAIGMAIRVR